ncbi:GNAT family N-acetyltransferase [Pelagibius sp. 7325]|uniref:GNAT family N-acetyltransferase n=1 Tax=Pelagibius sp. 7325 TaxID=3131994 RepID=UPI0030EF193E
MDTADLAWRAEEACMNAWPSPREAILDGWRLRAAGGAVRRTNSVNPLRGERGDPRAIISLAEAVYTRLGQASLFRVPSLTADVDEALDAAGYAAEGHTLTLFAELRARAALPHGAEISATPSIEWLSARQRLNGVDAREQRIYETMLDSILLPKSFAAARVDADIAALAYGVVCDGLAVIESVITDAAWRGRGLGKQVVGALLDWAREAGAAGACLQVVADNAPAVALYRSLGFQRELYRYHYRRLPLESQRQA